jgi:hypothetical protein
MDRLGRYEDLTATSFPRRRAQYSATPGPYYYGGDLEGNATADQDCGHPNSMKQPQAVTALLLYWLQDG